MNTEQQQRIEQIEAWQASRQELVDAAKRGVVSLDESHPEIRMHGYIDFLLSIVKEQEADRRNRRDPYSEECRAAINELERRFESEEVELCSIGYARQREDYGADQMRSLCVEKVKLLAESWAKSVDEQWDDRPDLSFDAAERLKAAGEIIKELESVSIQEQKS